jgi:hypothetical protein
MHDRLCGDEAVEGGRMNPGQLAAGVVIVTMRMAKTIERLVNLVHYSIKALTPTRRNRACPLCQRYPRLLP